MLTKQQENFAEALSRGLSQTEAYKLAYPASKNWTERSVWSKASQSAKNPKIITRIEALQTELKKQNLWTREQAVKTLVEVIHSSGYKSSLTIQAIKELNNMHGFNAPQKVELTGKDGKELSVFSELNNSTLIEILKKCDEYGSKTS